MVRLLGVPIAKGNQTKEVSKMGEDERKVLMEMLEAFSKLRLVDQYEVLGYAKAKAGE